MNYNTNLLHITSIPDVIYTIIALTCLSITFTKFEPIQKQVRKLLKLQGKVYQLIGYVLTCPMCFALQISFLSVLDIYIACIVSVLTSLINSIINRI